MNPATGIKQRILSAAEAILRRDGALRLTQPEVARVAKIRQSHLTYYFPRRADLLFALATVFLDRTAEALAPLEGERAPDARAVIATIAALIAPSDSMRAFIALIVEADQDPALRALLVPRMSEFAALIAGHLGRRKSDPDVALLLAAIRGFGLENLLSGREGTGVDAAELARRLGFVRVSRPPSRRAAPRAARKKKG